MFFRKKRLKIIGSIESVDIAGIKNIPAKIDTGADSSSIWSSDINMTKDGTLTFSLFDDASPLYTGDIIKTKKYSVRAVRSSTGEEQIRYRVLLPLTIEDETYNTYFTLSDRSRNTFPVLIGRHSIKKRFLVDVSIEDIERPKTKKRTTLKNDLNEEMKTNPYKFHHKYIKKIFKEKK